VVKEKPRGGNRAMGDAIDLSLLSYFIALAKAGVLTVEIDR
jgi:hypothetical protein